MIKGYNIIRKACKRVLPTALALMLAIGLFSGLNISVVKADSDYDEGIETLLAKGEYEENCVIAVVRADLEEKTLSGVFSADSVASLVDSAEPLMTVSKETVEEALNEKLPNADEVAEYSDTLVSVESIDDEAIQIIKVESNTLSTAELLYALADDERVICAEPNYIYTINNDYDTPDENNEIENTENEELTITEDTVTSNDGIDLSESEDVLSSEISTTKILAPTPLKENVFGEAVAVTGAYSAYNLSSLQWGYLDEYNGSFKRTTADVEKTYNYTNMGIKDWNNKGIINSTGVVAVMDTGVDYTNPDLANVMVTDAFARTGEGGTMGINVYDSEYANNPMDTDGHGTHCAGVIAAEWNDYGTSGAANGVKILAVKIDRNGNLSSDAIVKGYAYLEKYAKSATSKDNSLIAVNNSWGSDLSSNTLLSILCTSLGKAGTISVFSSGNSNYDNDVHASTVTLLAGNPYVVSVNAADFDGTKASYSNYGMLTTNVYGAGTEILSTYPSKGKICGLADTDPIYRNYFSSDSFESNLIVAKVQFNEAGNVIFPSKLSDLVPADSVAVSTNSSVDKGTYSLEFGKGAHSYWLAIPVAKNDISKIAYISAYIYGADAENPVCRIRPVLTTGYPSATRECCFCGGDSWTCESLDLTYFYSEGNTQDNIVIDENNTLALFLLDTYDNVNTSIHIDCLALHTKDSANGAAGKYMFLDGTSMATPSVTGCAAIVAKNFAEYGTSEAAIRVADYLKAHVSTNANYIDTCTQGGMVNLLVESANTVPVIKSIKQNGNEITVSGSYFGTEKGKITVNYSEIGTEAIKSWSDTETVFEYAGSSQGEVMVGVITKEKVVNEGETTGGKTGYSKMVYIPGEYKLFSNTLATPTSLTSATTGSFSTNSTIHSTSFAGVSDYLYAMMPQGIYNNYSTLLRYDIKNDAWSAVKNIGEFYNCSLAAYNEKIFIFASTWQNVYLYSYDPKTDIVENIDVSAISGENTIYLNATIINADNQLMLIGGTTGDGAPLLSNNIAEIYIKDNVLSYKPVGTIALAGTEGQDYLGVVSPKVTEFNGRIYVGCFTSKKKKADGSYTANMPNKLIKLSYSDGQYVATDISSVLPEFCTTGNYKGSNGYLTTFGLTNSYKGLLFSGANLKSEGGNRAIADTFFIGDKVELLGYSADFDTLFYPSSITYGGKLYTIGMSKYNKDGDYLVFRSVDIGSYQVDFNNNGYGNQPYTQQIERGEKVDTPRDLKSEGLVFEGWYTDKKLTKEYDFNTPVNSDFTLYAKWEKLNTSLVVNTPDGSDILVDNNKANKIAEEFAKKYKSANANLIVNVGFDYEEKDTELIEKAASGKLKYFFDVTLSLKTNNGEVKNIGNENTEVLPITYSFDLSDKKDFQVFRVHNGKVEELKETKNDDGEYIQIDKTNNKITICASKYSTYAIAFLSTNVPDTGDNNNAATWIIICILAVVSLALLFKNLYRRKKAGR